jgi:hypothetical protein
MKQTAVDFLAENYNYITWLRNRDEISAGTADEWRAKFFKEAKEMENRQIVDAYDQGIEDGYHHPEVGYTNKFESSDDYFNKTFKKE